MREMFHSFTGRLDYCAGDVERQLEALAYLEAQALPAHPFEDFNGRAVRVMVAEAMRRLDFPVSSSASNGTPPSMPGSPHPIPTTPWDLPQGTAREHGRTC
ncbi:MULTISPECIES: hypothetical protein [Rhodococcus]|nr:MULTISPECIES: hypothetical protein [Rhodococcus]